MSKCQFAEKIPDEIEVIPIVLGRRLKGDDGSRSNVNVTCRPKEYEFTLNLCSGKSLIVKVSKLVYLQYVPEDIYNQDEVHYTRRIDFFDKSQLLPEIDWKPDPRVTTTEVERQWVKDTSWRNARDAADQGDPN